MYDTALTTLIEHNGWPEIPLKITTREGRILDATNDTWHLPYSMKAHTTLDFSTIINLGLRWVIKRYIQEKIQVTSTHAGYSAFQDIRREFLRFQHNSELINTSSSAEKKRQINPRDDFMEEHLDPEFATYVRRRFKNEVQQSC